MQSYYYFKSIGHLDLDNQMKMRILPSSDIVVYDHRIDCSENIFFNYKLNNYKALFEICDSDHG